MTSFLVSNGAHPEMLERLADEDALPTQLYLSLTFFDEKSFCKVCGSAEGYEKFLESLGVMNSMRGKTRTALRMTLAKGLNLGNAGDYAELVKRSGADYVEVKAWMALGSSRERLGVGAMPSHEEIRGFAGELAGECGYAAGEEHVPSRVVLLCRDEKALKARFITSPEG
jgi:tRNA wybutosine-synthesizing protein 1